MNPGDFPHLDRPPLRKIDKYGKPECPGCNIQRYTQALLVMIGFIISFGIRCNVGVATVKMMTNQTNEEGNVIALSEFHWSPETIGYVDASFFWGYIITQLPGGFLASRWPANRLFGTAIFLSSCLNLLIPAATKLDPTAVIVVRFIQGLVEGVTYPACFGIWRWWAPPLERSILATLAFCGSYGGAVLGMPVSGYLAEWIGWYAPFYFYGCAGIVWYMFWLWLSFEKPSKHPSISPREQRYIEKSLGDSKASAPTIMTTPWVKLITSIPVWAIIVANFCWSWSLLILLIIQPRFFKEVYAMNVAEGSTLAALPHLIMTIIVPIGGEVADFLRKKEVMSTTNVRKVFNCGGFGLQAICLLIVGYTRDKWIAVAASLVAVGSTGLSISGFNVNLLDIAPRYASILMGISNGVGTLAGVICPFAIQPSINNYGSQEEILKGWGHVFLITAGIQVVGAAFYAIFASGELQHWAVAAPEEENMEENADLEKPSNMDGSELNTDTGADESTV